MAKKSIPPIRNWDEYNTSLINRGNITLWRSEEAIEKWYNKGPKQRGRPKIYSDDAICQATLALPNLGPN